MEKILFDSHAHISDEAFDAEKDAFIEEIRASQLKYCMDIGSSVKTSMDCVESARKYDFCYASVGIHPSEVAGLTESILDGVLEYYITEPKVVAVGEIGLDYHYDDGPSKEEQIYWFERQIKWAVDHDAPIAIHSREADEDTMACLKRCGAFSKKRAAAFPKKPGGGDDLRVLLHCFSGSAELAKQYVKLGATISLAGPVTFKNARKAVEVAEAVGIDDLLIETDSPYMAPVPMRGKVNRPIYVEYVARKIAEIKGISYEEAARKSLANACRFYGIEDK